MSRLQRYVVIALVAAVAGLAMTAAFTIADRSASRTIGDTAAQRLEVYRGSLLGEIRRYDYLSTVLSLNDELVALLTTTSDGRGADEVSAYLEIVARESKAMDIYVMDLEGRTVAASNYRRRDSFVGTNFSFRPYFQDALSTGHGHFYGVGTVSNEPGYYFASRVYAGQRLVGVATVKVSLHSLDNSLQDPDEIALAIDANGVIFLSSFPELLFKTLEPLLPPAVARLTATRQYHTQRSFEAIGERGLRRPFDDADTVRFKPAAKRSPTSTQLAREYLLLDRPVDGTQWRLTMLTSLAPARAAARYAAMTTGFAFVTVLLLALVLRQRWRARSQQQRAKAELELAYNDLEHQVELRTEALREANQNLQHEVHERMKTEAALKNTFEELVHSGKMAALGQMATSITHELNQPLAALQTLSDNAIVLLRRDRTDDAGLNLAEISQLVSRMGKITGELKSFARKAPLRTGPVDLCRVVEETVSLLRARLRQERISVRTVFEQPSVTAVADANRLEQVLVNLVNNAIDAMRPSVDRTLTIAIREGDGHATITVRDTGVGLASEAIDRLFEPFFTTKAAGQGLGLGLPISAEIVKEFGGTMAGFNVTDGAEFRIELLCFADHEEHA